MSYQALYRVYRPAGFDQLIGQDHIRKTLQNAVAHEKFTHAYLFTGPRGTGKTSAAKLLAKAINCGAHVKGEPCNECYTCKAINSNPDVIEIDAASNNGVDEIREIRDKVRFTPTRSKFKVYIIDEVHMLTTAAFNALLKTLEEPPAHAVFILATTDVHKVPLTIISRCQRYDFRRISTSAIVDRMKYVVADQMLQVEERALEFIARVAQGGMRDALSLLDKAISYATEDVTLEDVIEVTGAVSFDLLSQIVRAVAQKDTQGVLKLVNALIDSGKDPEQFVDDLATYYRDILMYQVVGKEAELQKAILEPTFEQLTKKINESQVYRILDELSKCQSSLKRSSQGRVTVEVSFVRLCAISSLEDEVAELKREVAELKKNGLVTEVTQEVAATAEIPMPEPPVENKEEIFSSNDEDDFFVALKKDVQNGSDYVQVIETTDEDIEALVGPPIDVEQPVFDTTEDIEALVGSTIVDEQPMVETTDADLGLFQNTSKELLNDVKNRWDDILKLVKKGKMTTFALLREAEVVLCGSDKLVVTYKHAAKCNMVKKEMNKNVIENSLKELLGRTMVLEALTLEEWEVAKNSYLALKK